MSFGIAYIPVRIDFLKALPRKFLQLEVTTKEFGKVYALTCMILIWCLYMTFGIGCMTSVMRTHLINMNSDI